MLSLLQLLYSTTVADSHFNALEQSGEKMVVSFRKNSDGKSG